MNAWFGSADKFVSISPNYAGMQSIAMLSLAADAACAPQKEFGEIPRDGGARAVWPVQYGGTPPPAFWDGPDASDAAPAAAAAAAAAGAPADPVSLDARRAAFRKSAAESLYLNPALAARGGEELFNGLSSCCFKVYFSGDRRRTPLGAEDGSRGLFGRGIRAAVYVKEEQVRKTEHW